MLNPVKILSISCLICTLFSFQTRLYGQVTNSPILKIQIEKFKSSPVFTLLKELYNLNNNQLVWLNKDNQKLALYSLINSCDQFGLNEKDYTLQNIRTLRSSEDVNVDSIQLYYNDINLSEVALHFFTNLSIGNKSPNLSYRGIKYNPSTSNLPYQLLSSIKAGTLKSLTAYVQPKSIEYNNTINLLGHLNSILKDTAFKEVTITSNKVNKNNKPLIIKLFQLGILDSPRFNLNDAELAKYLRKAQKMMDVLSDGTLRTTSIQALNVSLKRRYSELVLLINYLRWLNQLKQNSFVAILNIPSADLHVYDHDELVLYSRAIVGKRATPTPTLSSTITEVVLYPYWMVPYKIATRELLPSIKRNIKFLDFGGYQVLNKSGNIVRPESIPWESLSSTNFPYTIRQSTGCDNSLGLIKFQFESSYSVYLHDTPSKGLFYLNKRYFSHGCMRIEKPVELADLILGVNKLAVDTLTQKGCLQHQSPITLKVEKPLKIVVMYSTAWYNTNGDIIFYEDIYNKL